MIASVECPRQREAYEWFATELANLRTAFRWAADHGDLDDAATIATYAGLPGMLIENFEPSVWSEEMIEPAKAVDHPRLAALYVMAAQCYMAGRIDEAIRYSDGAQIALRRCCDEPPYGAEGWVGGAYLAIGQPERWVELCHAQLGRRHDTHVHVHIRACLVIALTVARSGEEAMAAADGLIEAAEATRNPYVLSFALLASGAAFHKSDPPRALDAYRRGVAIARDSGNRANETHLAVSLARLEAEHGDPRAAFDYVTLAIRNYHNAGNTTMIGSPFAVLATLLDRLGRHESAATIAGFAFNHFTVAAAPEINTTITHLREVLGDQTYESLARKGETMTTAAMATYAYDQIDQARTELTHTELSN